MMDSIEIVIESQKKNSYINKRLFERNKFVKKSKSEIVFSIKLCLLPLHSIKNKFK